MLTSERREIMDHIEHCLSIFSENELRRIARSVREAQDAARARREETMADLEALRRRRHGVDLRA